MEKLKKALEENTGENLYQMILSNPRDKGIVLRMKIRPVLLRDKLFFLTSRYVGKEISLTHNRKKHYILEEDHRVDFLVDLGVQTAEGKIVRAKYDKFRQTWLSLCMPVTRRQIMLWKRL